MTEQERVIMPKPAPAKLQLSNAYLVAFDQLARVLDAACKDDRERIPQVDLAITVGFANRQVKNLASIAQSLGLLQKVTYKPTPLGLLVQQHDPFFDDLGTLWLLHYLISSDPRHLIWCRLVTEFIPAHRTFTRDQARAIFQDLHGQFSAESIKKHVLSEINTVLDAYTNQHFARLAYVTPTDMGYALGSREPVPALVLAACMVAFRNRHAAGSSAVDIQSLLTDPCGPGVVCQISEERLRATLETLKNESGLSLESRADLDQVRLTDELTPVDWMRRYYEQR